jgi:hypothetical protein
MFVKNDFMTVKLNLTINEKNARVAKTYAKRRKTSVSKIVDAYFSSLAEKEQSENKTVGKSIVDKHKAIFKKYADKSIDDIDKAKDEYLMKKYGL